MFMENETKVTEKIKVEVVYGTPLKQTLLALYIDKEATVEECIHQSKICDYFPEIRVSEVKVGIFSRATTLDSHLKNGDRVEIYRPLIADPKELRKIRAARALKEKE